LYDHRFSDDLRWVMATAHRYAVTSGSPSLTTAHVLAAIATHPKGPSLLGHDAANIQSEASGGQAEHPTPIPPRGRLALQPDVKSLVQGSLMAMRAAGWTRLEIENVYSVLIGMRDSSAAPVLQKFGIIPPGGSGAG
jgi:ATP-dependent Clp protease ATP-binding subunit ClpA